MPHRKGAKLTLFSRLLPYPLQQVASSASRGSCWRQVLPYIYMSCPQLRGLSGGKS
ncbi:hypothetical protein HMPREF3185_00267 [Porphyromonas somerae]|uniref:Uncharacterized protein n=1 Tax=Porphyromonas somerae TaxID=322095 RepID=A0A134BE81_9PORP|nr:hypothetical protein HMPREF3184_00267 [Porphyromonadaceae bacterium KA00676]KXB78180.1 hypothetical protein HMPREF3185_00267 [Porphyromonas somerae]